MAKLVKSILSLVPSCMPPTIEAKRILKIGLENPTQTQRVVYNGYEQNIKTRSGDLTDGEY